MGVDSRVRLQVLLFEQSRIVTIFPAATVVVVLSVLPGSHWSQHSFITLLVVAGGSATAACLRLAFGNRLPLWSFYVEPSVATVGISALAAIGPSGHVDFAVLYLWIALYTALYFRLPVALLYTGVSGVAYLVVLAVGSNVDKPVVAWLTIFGTALVLVAVVRSLVDTLQKRGHEDPLTGLPNRRSWDQRADEELERARRNKTPLSIALIDVDNFKAVNDRDGHPAGDRLLRQFADGWRGTIRGSGDFIARLGGDEFGLLAPGSDHKGIQRVVERLHEISPQRVSCSIGVATWDGAETTADLFRRADEAMYQIKREQRDRVARPRYEGEPV
jgi:diguanylate cyclase (GGDEF)-like protein